jgi:RimJ/RimL family protein N-acetyltransferase
MNLTLSEVFTHPSLVTYAIELPTGGDAILRPLQADDVDKLTLLLEGLSLVTRRFSLFPSYDRVTAQALCEAINRYDKLRFVVEIIASQEIIGLFEFSFDIPEGDILRYAQQGVDLDARYDCRFGPVLTDAYQNSGVGSKVFPYIVDVAKRFGKERIILWGGVLCDNARAIRYYEKQGFRPVAMFVSHDGIDSLDMILDLRDGEG